MDVCFADDEDDFVGFEGFVFPFDFDGAWFGGVDVMGFEDLGEGSVSDFFHELVFVENNIHG